MTRSAVGVTPHPRSFDAVIAEGIGIALYGGGLWEQETRLTADKRDYIRHHDGRIAELSGRPFDTPYLDKLLSDVDMVLWSRPTIAAILAAGALRSGADLAMLRAIQKARCVRARASCFNRVLAACGVCPSVLGGSNLHTTPFLP